MKTLSPSINGGAALKTVPVTEVDSICPYCGVGCGTLIKVENGRVVGMVPDKKHPTNRGIQCIKGLNAHEPIYIDRLTKVLVRKDMSDPLTGHVSNTKGQFGDDVFREATYEEAEELVADKIAAKSSLVVAMGKEAFYRQLEQGLEDAYAYAGEVMARNMMAEDAAEGIDAFLEKRPPVWRER